MFRWVTMAIFALSSVSAADWPRFRGPNGTGVSENYRLPNEIRPGLELWKVAIPAGHSSPTVANDRLYVTAAEGDKLLTIALEARTGKELWRRFVLRERKEHLDKRNHSASPSPAADGDRVVVFFPEFGLVAYDHKGRPQWNLRLGPFDNSYGMGASPVLVDRKVVLVCDQSHDSYIAAFDASSGKLLWRTPRPRAISGHSTPVVHRSGRRTLIVAPGSFRMDAYESETGQPVWWLEGLPSEMKSTPIIHGDTVFVSGYNLPENERGRQIQVSSFAAVLLKQDKNRDHFIDQDEAPDAMTRRYFPYFDLDHNGKMDEREWRSFAEAFKAENSLQAVRLGGSGDITLAHVKWKYFRAIPQLPSPIAYRGDLYMINDNGVLTILDQEKGTLRKQFRLNGATANYYSSPVAGDGKVYFVSYDGTVTVVDAGDHRVLSRASFDDLAFATPAIVKGLVFLRTATTLYCFTSKG